MYMLCIYSNGLNLSLAGRRSDWKNIINNNHGFWWGNLRYRQQLMIMKSYNNICLKWFIEDKSMCNLNVHCYLPVYTNSQNKCVNQMYTMHQQTDQCILETIFQYLETILNLIDSLFVIKKKYTNIWLSKLFKKLILCPVHITITYTHTTWLQNTATVPFSTCYSTEP